MNRMDYLYLCGFFLLVCAAIGCLTAAFVVTLTGAPVIAVAAAVGVAAYVEMGRVTWRALA